MVGVPLGTYVGSELGYLEGCNDRYVNRKFDNLLDTLMDLI